MNWSFLSCIVRKNSIEYKIRKRKYLEASNGSGGLRRRAWWSDGGGMTGPSHSPLGESIHNIPSLFSSHFRGRAGALVKCILWAGEDGGGRRWGGGGGGRIHAGRQFYRRFFSSQGDLISDKSKRKGVRQHNNKRLFSHYSWLLALSRRLCFPPVRRLVGWFVYQDYNKNILDGCQ